ncbi:MAG TPA: CRISPR-associated endonuclease Cas2 [Saprospiraceae bacterium]|jgi:CRISPR-associated protein Cas2|nr:CRISPR-associated endonuclease Cas2 [Saprospiraceae bacterium]MBK8828320.1 CRISPR-associated endonuclease Cas2 [Saprospiraceae bacterium]MBK8887127.1 CRISPR-associated endonuclease Cas2 [Saprospiraceae bacterium]MBK9583094.1 CRISPR-associated endonuclease Cas2 [Saprospiraceae bacterium]HRG40253.1 CRISPR-associated endonuclease Cas2 [Saprospiraceae bacterium]
MYIIAVYDVGEKRVVKMLKLCRQYLNWIQNSVFEGELTEVQLKELKYKAKEIMKDDEDSFIIFSSREQKWMDKQVIGKEKNSLDNFL